MQPMEARRAAKHDRSYANTLVCVRPRVLVPHLHTTCTVVVGNRIQSSRHRTKVLVHLLPVHCTLDSAILHMFLARTQNHLLIYDVR
jgi:hypothetical protein